MSRRKIQYRTYSRDNYNRFLAENKLTKEDISFEKYRKNLEVCNWMYVEYALRTGEKVKLPHGFGFIAVNKKMLSHYKNFLNKNTGKKFINLRIDYNETRKHGKVIYHTNEHSDGYNFKWVWFPKEAKFFLHELYVFNPGRYASRAIAKYVKKPNSEYKELYMNWINNKK
jgi:hypothetical protein